MKQYIYVLMLCVFLLAVPGTLLLSQQCSHCDEN